MIRRRNKRWSVRTRRSLLHSSNKGQEVLLVPVLQIQMLPCHRQTPSLQARPKPQRTLSKHYSLKRTQWMQIQLLQLKRRTKPFHATPCQLQRHQSRKKLKLISQALTQQIQWWILLSLRQTKARVKRSRTSILLSWKRRRLPMTPNQLRINEMNDGIII